MAKTVIGICTYQRPAMLMQALEGVNKLAPTEGETVILIVDNDREGTARSVVDEFKRAHGREVIYCVEPIPGLVSARNRLLEEALSTGARFMACFDDDAVPEPGWLVNLHRVQAETGATAVAGPQVNDWEPLRRTDERHPLHIPEGSRREKFGTGNYIIDLGFIRKHGIRFDPQFNFTGGEDIDFSATAHKAGATFVWTNTAVTRGLTHPERMSTWASLKRTIGLTQAYMMVRLKHRGNKPWAYWFTTLSIKLAIALLTFPIHALRGREARQRRAVKCAEYLGRLLFFCGVRVHPYRKS